MTRSFIWMRIALLLARWAFGLLFLWAAFGKIVDPDKFARQVVKYQIVGPQASAVVGAILPWAEFIVGSCLVAGIQKAGAWLGTIILFGCFVAARAAVIHTGLSIECGCGVMDGIITTQSVVIAAACLLTAILAYAAEIRTAASSGHPPLARQPQWTQATSAPKSGCLKTRAFQTGMVLIALATPLGLNDASAATQSNISAATNVRRAGCEALQPDFDRVVAAHADQPEVATLVQRMAAMDRLADAVLQDLRLQHSTFLNQSLATVGGSSLGTADAPQLLGAAKIVEKYQSAFATPPVPSALQDADRQVLNNYVQTASQTLTQFIQSRGRTCMSVVGVDGPEVIRLSFVMNMLTSAQDQSLLASAPPLPKWMSHPTELRILQDFAVESARPRLAFALARAGENTTAPADASVAYLSFVSQAADTMLRTAKYSAAIACLRDGITVASSTNKDADATDLSFRLAEVLETTDSPQAAAEEMRRVRSTCRRPNDYGHASTLRLKYLYEGGDDQTLATEASADLKDSRCEGYLPQIMYIAWAACRRDGADAERWRKAFLDRFPDHPLGAQMYFAAAMDALAASNCDEALRLLQFIEYRFPQSKLIDKVRQIHQRLSAADESHGSAMAADAAGQH